MIGSLNLISIMNLLLVLMAVALANDGSVGPKSPTNSSISSTGSIPGVFFTGGGASSPAGNVQSVPNSSRDRSTSQRPPFFVNPITQNSSNSTENPYDGQSYFLSDNSTLITVQVKSNAMLPCHVKNNADGVTVSWIRRKDHKDYHLLTVGLQTYSSDDRFQAIHAQSPEDWTLKIKYVQERDQGVYECQISTHPPSSIFYTLRVVEAVATIPGGPDKYIKSGSTLRLICELKQSFEPPEYIFWYQGLHMINYDPNRNINVTLDRYSSTLEIHNVQRTDSGNFSCVPSNAIPSHIFVYVVDQGENPAAMYSASSELTSSILALLIESIIISIFLQR